MENLNFGIIGVGRFGRNYLRTLNEMNESSVKWICSSTEKTLSEASSGIDLKYQIKKTADYGKILDDKEVDAVVISTPGSTHYKISKEALLAGKHVLVEKPMCFSSREAEDLAKTAKKKNKILMAGHLHLFNPGIQKLREDIKNGLFGKINYISIFHSGNGPVRTDINALWDFFPHSVSVLLHLLESNPVKASVNGKSFIKKGNEDIVSMHMKFPDDVFALSTGTWLHPQKKMEVVVAGEKLYAVFDDYAADKLRYFDSVPKLFNKKIIIDGKGAKKIPISDSKPLAGQIKYFLNLVKTGNDYRGSLKLALKTTKILEMAQKSLKSGKEVKISNL